MKLSKGKLLIILITLILFFLPFFWLKPGQLDLGGDSNRLYFYSPLLNLQSFAFYSVGSWGTGIVVYNQYFIPYLLLLSCLKFILGSSTILIDIFNGLKLAGSFLFMLLIIKELFQKNIPQKYHTAYTISLIIGALFYTLSPAVLDNTKYALVTHDLVFLNPIIFYLLLRFMVTTSMKYIWSALLISFIFSSSFSLYGPPLFAFYIPSLCFLFLYNKIILQKSIPWKKVMLSVLFFFGLHSFHVIPVISNVFDKGSEFNTRVFEAGSKLNAGLEYFNGIITAGKVSKNILLPLENSVFSLSLIIIPFLTILGFFFLKKKNKTILLVSIFFLLTLFLISANISHIGVEFYRKLFFIPGFGMFRNFYGQWQFVFTFFYSILVGLIIFSFISKLKKKYIYTISFITISALLIRSGFIFNGDIIHATHRTSKNVSNVIRIDPQYEKFLFYLKQLPNDGKILDIPFTDFAYNIVGGVNNAAYIGQSMPSFLSSRNDFAGYQNLDPFSETFRQLVMEKDYAAIKQILSLLQIRYVFYNSDPKISETFFPAFPYGYSGVPASESAELDFVHNISEEKVYQVGNYSLFEVAKSSYLPHFYTPSYISPYNINPTYDGQFTSALSFLPSQVINDTKDPRIAYIDKASCEMIFSHAECNESIFGLNDQEIHITYQKINPTKYRVTIQHNKKPFVLVFSNKFSPYWNVYNGGKIQDKKIISDSYFDGSIVEFKPFTGFFDPQPFETNTMSKFPSKHLEVNGYANAWYIDPKNNSQDIELIVEMSRQKIFYYSAIISVISLVVFLIFGIKIFKN